MKHALLMLLLGAALLTSPARAEERLELDRTTILGNRELPKVTFVIPWRDVDVAIPDWPLERLVDEPLAPIDREVYELKTQQVERLHNFVPPVKSGK